MANRNSNNYCDDHDEGVAQSRTALMIFTTTVGVICGLTAPFVFTRTVLPYMATPKGKVEAALRFCLQNRSSPTTTTLHGKRRATPQPPVFVDLGSGDGEAVKQAAKLGYRAIGLELNFTMWLVSSIRRQLFFSAGERARSQIIWGNMFDHSLGIKNGWKADTVMIFGVTPLMPSISRKLQAECQPGTQILAYRFGIPLCHPNIQRSEGSLLRGRIVYDRQEMRIYEKLKM